MNTEVEKAFHNILDTFTGADGGVDFVRLKSLIEDMDEKERSGDKAAGEVLDIMMRFNNLINYAKENY